VTDRLSRPPVKLKAAQPDGTNNGLHRAAAHFLSDAYKDSRFLVVEVEREEKVHKDATGADVAILGIAKVGMPADQQQLAAMLHDCLAADFEGTVPAFPVTDRGRYEAALDAWAEKEDLGPAEVRAAWEKHFGAEVIGPIGADTALLAEFVLEVAGGLPEIDDDPGPDEPPADDEPAAGGIPANPCHDWSEEVEHGPHTWIAPNDGKSACPGWPPASETESGPDGMPVGAPAGAFSGEQA
jgi:hypothetical protein